MDTEITSGNFGVKITGDIDESREVNVGTEEKPEQREAGEIVREAGITYIVQRDGLSAVYNGLLDKGQKRNTLEYSDGTAQKFAAALEKALAPYGDFAVEVAEHTPSAEVSPMVRATRFVDELLGTDKEPGLRMVLGATAETDRDELIKLAHASPIINPPRNKKAA